MGPGRRLKIFSFSPLALPVFFVYLFICLFVYNMFVFCRQLLLSLSLGASPTSAHWPGGFRGQQAQVLMMIFVMMVYICVFVSPGDDDGDNLAMT